MKIAIVGSGHIGGGLGRAWAKKDHAVIFAARDVQEPELAALCKSIGARAETVGNAAREADVFVIAAPYAALDDVLAAAGDLAGKVVVDCTNAVKRVDDGMTLEYGHTTSAAEQLQKRLPAARVFKSFNAQGAENLANPVYGGVPASNFFCGDDAEARRIVKQLVEDVGFEAIDAGPLKNARLLEPLMLLWMATSRAVGTRDIAFKVLQR